jgi:photosystem II stability/assembly factor-like uncharacterized protein
MRSRRFLNLCLTVLLTTGLAIQTVQARQESKKNSSFEESIKLDLFKNLAWRNIGPANMMGRVTDVEGVPGNANIVYVGTASGGIWKTVNGGVTWIPVFDDQPVASIGDLALEPGNPDVVYVGTGESNVRNSVSFGNGVYKSPDGGKTWWHMGLEDTEHISRIVINPKNSEVIYVGALGHAFGPNPMRGVFMSTNGGKTWEKVLYTDDLHGVADMDINPQNPNIIYAGIWRFERKPWTFTSGDEEGGVFRSIDGGCTWNKLTRGLPKLVGRIGVKISLSNPDVVYVMTESPEGTLYRSDDRGETFRRVSDNVEIVSRGFYYTDLRVDPADENRVYAVSSRLSLSIDGGNSFERISRATHSDYHTLWIDPENPSRMWQGQDGGVCVSYDRGETWDYVNNFPVGQFYQICADSREPFYYVGGGLQDNGTWYGPSRNKEPFGILNDDWRMISFGDGFHIVVHPNDHELFLSESQGANIMRTDMRTREQQSVSPQPRRADGAPVSSLKYRFNWNTPIIPSAHDPETVYVGGNVVFKSADFGLTWKIISPDLTTNDPNKQQTAGGPAWTENTTAEYHCTIISLAESPLQPGILWAGTDDGNLHVSLNGGESWKNVIENVPRIPPYSPVSHLEPSRTSAGVAYCSFDRHMLDDFNPYVYKTSDFGRTWTNVTGNLPEKAYVWVVKEDPRNPNVVYAGTELGLYVSLSGGKNWISFRLKNLPTVAVHDILTHPRDNDLIIGTHGRSIWIFDDVSFLQELSPDALAADAHLFTIRPALRYTTKPTRYGIGDKVFRGLNPPYGALITYYFKEKPKESIPVNLEILDEAGRQIRILKNIPREAGLNRVNWDLRFEGPRPRREMRAEEDFFFRGPQGPQVLPGTYTARLHLGDRTFERPVGVRLDPTVQVSLDALQIQQNFAFGLRDIQSFINDGLRALDSLAKQLDERKDTVREQGEKFPSEVLDAIESHLKKIESIQESLARPEGRAFWSEGPRLVGRMSRLFGSIDGVNASPTRAQEEYYRELLQEFRGSMAEVNDYLGQSIKELNRIFRKYQVPPLLLPDPIQLIGRQDDI